jgi:hypothetical protein
MPVEEPKKKRRRDRKVAAEHRRQMNERIQCQDGCRRKGLAVARRGTSCRVKVTRQTKKNDRKMSRHGTVAWRKSNIFRKIMTHGNCGPRKEVTATGIQITRCAGHKRMGEHKYKVTTKTIKILTFGKRLWKGPECNTGIRDKGLKTATRQQTDEESNHERHRGVGPRKAITSGNWRNTQKRHI